MSRASLALLLLASCASPPPPELTGEERDLLRPYETSTDSIRRKVESGDALFQQAISAQKQADRPEALRLYQSARSEYLQAQVESGRPVPAPLIRRVNECVNRIAALQRR